MHDSKKQLYITLTEPVVFLRSPDPTGRFRPDPNDPPTLIRGVLNLNVAKTIGISSIEVELTGVFALQPPEEVALRGMNLPDKITFYTSTVTVFCADQVARGRRPVSVAPRLSTTLPDHNVEHSTTPLSPPRSPAQGRPRSRNSISVPPGLGPSPPYTFVAQSLTPAWSRLDDVAESPTRTLEEWRQALRDSSERQTNRDRSTPTSSRSHVNSFSFPDPVAHASAPSSPNDALQRESDDHTDDATHASNSFEGHVSSHNTTEETPHTFPRHGHSSNHSSRAHSPDGAHGHMRMGGCDTPNATAGRSRLHLSLSSVLDAVMEVASRSPARALFVPGPEEAERGRSRVRSAADGHGSSSGLEASEGTEFKPGTYSYPISFLLPSDLPPTLTTPHGSLSYVIKAVAHRPGTFTSKLSCQTPLVLVAAPAVGARESSGDPGPISVQKQWEDKLSYSIDLSSRLFLLGSQHLLDAAAEHGDVRASTDFLATVGPEPVYGTATLDLKLLPLDKVKLWRLSVFVDQCTTYTDAKGVLYETDRNQIKVLEVEDVCPPEELTADMLREEERAFKGKPKNKVQYESVKVPLIPTPVSPHRSPLLRYVPSSADPSDLAGPGPYALSIPLGLPGCHDPHGGRGLNFTVKQKDSRIKIDHTLRIALRVQSVGNDSGRDEEPSSCLGDKPRRMFDIAIKMPIIILSCRCVPEHHLLPTYTQITEDCSPQHAACVCACRPSVAATGSNGRDALAVEPHPITPVSSPSFEGDHGDDHDRPSSLSQSPYLPSPARAAPAWRRTPAAGRSHAHHHAHAHHRSGSHHEAFYVAVSESSTSTPRTSRPPSPLAQYERLVSGLESSAGEAPPSYESVTLGR